MTTILIYTDGASSGNPGPGGYAAVLVEGRRQREISGGFRLTTNNRMELYAAIAGLEAAPAGQSVRVYSDSQYLAESLNQGWVQVWQSKGWRKTKKEKVANADLWQRLIGLIEQRKVDFIWIEGHRGDPLNERANWLAQRALIGKDLSEDIGYEQADSTVGEGQASLFDQAVNGKPLAPKQADESTLTTTKVSGRKITRAGQACRKCGASVERRVPVRRLKPGQTYYYEYYLQCPRCGTIYLVDDARRAV